MVKKARKRGKKSMPKVREIPIQSIPRQVERCQNPGCRNTDIVVSIIVKGQNLPICRRCWEKIAESDHEW